MLPGVGEIGPLGAQPLPRVLERTASQVVNATHPLPLEPIQAARKEMEDLRTRNNDLQARLRGDTARLEVQQ